MRSLEQTDGHTANVIAKNNCRNCSAFAMDGGGCRLDVNRHNTQTQAFQRFSNLVDRGKRDSDEYSKLKNSRSFFSFYWR